ncbi:MAG: hypothetical protein RIA10_01000 [Amphiplicatus sp.]
MSHRLLVLAPLAPAAAVIALAAASVAAEAAANAMSANAVFANAAAQDEAVTENALEDVQVGESGNLMRVALICRTDCRVGARAGGAFFLPEIDAALDIDLKGRTKIAEALAFKPVAGGSALEIKASAAVNKASIKPCLIDGLAASCIDIEFGAARVQAAANAGGAAPNAAPNAAPSLAPKPAKAETALRENPSANAQAASTPKAPASVRPALRETTGEERLVFARFAAPERLAPPEAAPSQQSAPQQASIIRERNEPRPILREDKAAAFIGGDIDIAREAEAILGKRLGVAECGGAQARLRADAWALDAMVEVGFCEASSGALEKADGVFSRLLAYTPDNYEALVGRALIAAKTGERAVARRYYQDALNALPPIEESNRIVEAMTRL